MAQFKNLVVTGSAKASGKGHFGGLVTTADNELITHGNEFNFIPSGYNADVYLNYSTSDRGTGNVSRYRFCSGQKDSGTAILVASKLEGLATHATNDEAGNNIGNTYLKLSGGTMTGPLKVNDYIFGYRYTKTNNAPAFIWDKPSSHYTGVGANGTSDVIHFGPVSSSDFSWVSDYYQKYEFQGSMTVMKRLYTDEWIECRASGCGIYWPTDGYSLHVMPNTVSTYTPLRVAGMKNNYCGILLGDNNQSLNVMSSIPHQGLYNESNSRWIIYHNQTYDQVGIRTAPTAEQSWKVDISGDTRIQGALNVYSSSGSVKLTRTSNGLEITF